MTIYDIKYRTVNAPYFFSRETMKFFHQTLKDYSVVKSGNRYRLSAPMYDYDGRNVGTTVRYFNPATNELENS